MKNLICWYFCRGCNAKTLGDTRPQFLVHLLPKLESALLHGAFDARAHMVHDIVHQMVTICLRHHIAIEVAWLHKIVVLSVWCIGATHDLAARGPARIGTEFRIGLWTAVAVWRVDRLIPVMPVAHRPILIIAVHLNLRLIDWQLQIIGANTMTGSLGIDKETTHQHLARAGANPRHHICWLKGRLL